MTQVMQNMGGSAYNQRISSKYNTERNKGNAVYERCCKVKPVVRLVMWNYRFPILWIVIFFSNAIISVIITDIKIIITLK